MQEIRTSGKLTRHLQDRQSALLRKRQQLEDAGQGLIHLHTDNASLFGFEPPPEMIQDVRLNLHECDAYADAKGLFSARKAIMQYAQHKRIANVTTDHILLGNGVSELIQAGVHALLNKGDEVLIPCPDHPLWTLAVTLAGGTAVHYRCDEQSAWYPDLDDLRARITPATRALVIINPNNPTGAVYPRAVLLQMLEIARQHQLVVFSDEVHDKILFDGIEHVATASLAEDLLVVTLNGLSKNYRLAGFRSGWIIISGATGYARDYIEGLEMLCNMRMCANVPAMYAIQTALGGHQSIHELVAPEGLLRQQRDIAYETLNTLPGISCIKPQGALYCFPKLNRSRFNLFDDERMAIDLLEQHRILIMHGRAFQWPEPDHFRVVFLPGPEELHEAMSRMHRFFTHYVQA